MPSDPELLWKRAQQAMAEARRLTGERSRILERLADAAVHRRIVADDTRRWLNEAERRVVKSTNEAMRIARL